jgi:hypothetical protein
MEGAMGGQMIDSIKEFADINRSKFLLKLPQEYASATLEPATVCCFLYSSPDGRLFSFTGLGPEIPRHVWLFDAPEDAINWLNKKLTWLREEIKSGPMALGDQETKPGEFYYGIDCPKTGKKIAVSPDPSRGERPFHHNISSIYCHWCDQLHFFEPTEVSTFQATD